MGDAHYIVRTIWDGELLDSCEFDSEILAEAYYCSTIDRWNRSDDSEGVSVQMIASDRGDVIYERYWG